jgi:hypothetical protein
MRVHGSSRFSGWHAYRNLLPMRYLKVPGNPSDEHPHGLMRQAVLLSYPLPRLSDLWQVLTAIAVKKLPMVRESDLLWSQWFLLIRKYRA